MSGTPFNTEDTEAQRAQREQREHNDKYTSVWERTLRAPPTPPLGGGLLGPGQLGSVIGELLGGGGDVHI
jgi:hypothetical protein